MIRVGETDEFYLHAFSSKMPDLNWENEDLVTQSQYERALAYGLTPEEAFAAVSHRSRDNSRTPIVYGTYETVYDTIDNLIAYTRTSNLFRLLNISQFPK